MLKNRTLFFGDNLKVLREKFPQNEDGYFDLIYLDPPFNSNRSYNILFKEGMEESPAQLHAFEDTWHWNAQTMEQFNELVSDRLYPQKIGDLMLGLEKLVGHNDMMAYLTMMTVRLIELHRVLKNTGSIFLHCDPTASHYLKLVLDAIFGPQQFRNEIVWCYTGPGSPGIRQFLRKHDIIFWYSKGNTWTFNVDDVRVPHSEKTKANYKQGLEGSGFVGADHVIHEKGKVPEDWWQMAIAARGKEYLGYPTQKPMALLDRIIRAGSKEGDWILDPFGGCGTTAAVSEKLKRNWVIIDITTLAINLVKRRIEDMYVESKPKLIVEGLPEDLAGAMLLFAKDPFEFEYWCCDLIRARPAGDKSKGKMKGADQGIDGVITFPDKAASESKDTGYRQLLVQVKGGGIKSGDIRDFRGTIDREKAAGGIFVCLKEPTGPMRTEAVEAGSYAYNLTGQKYPKIQIITVDELLAGKKPDHPSMLSYAKQAEKVITDERQSML